MDTKTAKRYCVAGFVKSRHNRDGSTTFSVAGKGGQKFTVSDGSDHAKKLRSANRALVCYEETGRNPKIAFIITNPSHRTIRQYQQPQP